MRKNILTVALFVGIMSNAFALLPFGVYTGVRGGMKINSNTTTANSGQDVLKSASSPFAGAIFGVRLFSFRLELEHIFRINAIKFNSANPEKLINSQQSMANVYYTFLNFPFLDLYVNAGVGTNKIYSSFVTKYDKNVWSTGFGANINLFIISLEAGYRYFNMGKITIENSMKSRIDSHDIYVALKFGF